LKFSQFNSLPLRWGRVSLPAGRQGWPPAQRASGSERGGQKEFGPPPLHPLPPREGRVLVGINVRDKFSDFNV